jgi:hypothetical protein
MCVSVPTNNYGIQRNSDVGTCCETVFCATSVILYISALIIAPIELKKHDCNEILGIIATIEVYFAPVVIVIMFSIVLILECIDYVFEIKYNKISPVSMV